RINDNNSTSHINDIPVFNPANFNSKELSALHDIYSRLLSDYSIRREMLHNRLIFTIQSFVWSDKGKSNERQIREILHSKTKNMNIKADVDFIQLFTTCKSTVYNYINAQPQSETISSEATAAGRLNVKH